MQKKIIALAVAGLVSGAAFAQSNVTVYGTLDMSYLDMNQDTSERNQARTARTNTSADINSTGWSSGALSSNKWGLMGNEDLGNGLKAHFKLEFGMDEPDDWGADAGNDTSGIMDFRYQYIGLTGGFGDVTFGRQDVLIDQVWSIGSAGMKNNAAAGQLYGQRGFGNVLVIPNAANGIAVAAAFMGLSDPRSNELMTYTTPMFSGFQGKVQYGKGNFDVNQRLNGVANLKDDDNHTNYGMSLTYANGPLNVGFGFNKEKNEAGTNVTGLDETGVNFDRDSWLLGANYDLGVVKVFGQYMNGDANYLDLGAGTDTDRVTADAKGWEIGVHVPVTGQLTLMASYHNLNADTKYTDRTAGVVTSQGGEVDSKGYQLAALYSLSKRSTAYVMYGDNDSEATWSNSLAAGRNTTNNDVSQKTKQFAVGLRHTF